MILNPFLWSFLLFSGYLRAVNTALKQIEDKKYSVEMKELGINNILELGIAFEGKEVLIKERKKNYG